MATQIHHLEVMIPHSKMKVQTKKIKWNKSRDTV